MIIKVKLKKKNLKGRFDWLKKSFKMFILFYLCFVLFCFIDFWRNVGIIIGIKG